MIRSAPTVVKILLGADLALAALYLINYQTGQRFDYLTRLVNLTGEANIPTWFSSAQWLGVAVLLGLFALRNFNAREFRSWLLFALPFIFCLLSLDEVAQIHEWLGVRSDRLLPGGMRAHSRFTATGIWMFVVGVPFVFLFFGFLASIRLYFRQSRAALEKLVLGMAVMLFGAIGVETLSNFVVVGSNLHVLQVVIEEFLEMFGATIVLWGSLDLLLSHGFTIQLDAVTLPVSLDPRPSIASDRSLSGQRTDDCSAGSTCFGSIRKH